MHPSAAKVLEIGPFPPPGNGWSMRIAFLAEHLTKTGHDCIPLNLGENRCVPSPDYQCVYSGWDYVSKLVRYTWQGYTPHVHMNGDSLKGFLVSLIPCVIGFLLGRRAVVSLHAGIHQEYFPRSRSRLMVPAWKLLFSLPRVVVAENQEVRACILEYGIRPTKVVAISPFSRQYLQRIPEQCSDEIEHFFADHAPVILTYLENRPEYALASQFVTLQHVVQRYPNIGVIIAGAGGERQFIRQLAEQHGLAGNYLHVGGTDHATFLSILQRAAVYFRCNLREGTSASIREAICLGIPVVTCDSGAHPPDVITYPWGNSGAMTTTLLNVLEPQTRSSTRRSLTEIPDTVSEEVALLVQCATGAEEDINALCTTHASST